MPSNVTAIWIAHRARNATCLTAPVKRKVVVAAVSVRAIWNAPHRPVVICKPVCVKVAVVAVQEQLVLPVRAKPIANQI